jgi:DNA-binding response OmpR family regulator
VLKLLIVENDSGVRSSLSLGLSDIFEVSEAASGEEALSILAKEEPDLVLLDQHLGSLNGTTLLEQVSKSPKRPAVVMLSAGMNVDLARQAMMLGAQDCLSKPFVLDLLRQRLGSALAKRSLPQADQAPFAEKVAALLNERLASLGDRQLDLSSKSREFIKALVKEALLDALGDEDRAASKLGLSVDEFKHQRAAGSQA